MRECNGLLFYLWITIAAMPSLLCSLQILVGWELGQSIPTVFHTVPELSLWTEEIEWSHPSTMSSYSVIPFNIQRNWIWISSNGRYYSSILILDGFLEAMLVPGPPPFMSERKKGSWVWLWYSILWITALEKNVTCSYHLISGHIMANCNP